jgi:hypothetical protein
MVGTSHTTHSQHVTTGNRSSARTFVSLDADTNKTNHRPFGTMWVVQMHTVTAFVDAIPRHLDILKHSCFLLSEVERQRQRQRDSNVCNDGKSKDARMLITIDKIIDITDDSPSVIRVFSGRFQKLKIRIFQHVYVLKGRKWATVITPYTLCARVTDRF